MTKTLILLFHPDLKRSKANAALAGAAAKLDGVEVADMQAAYPDSMDMFRDGEREARRLLAPTVSCCSSPSSGIPPRH